MVILPLSGHEARGDLVLIQTSCFSHVDHVVLMLTSLHLHMKSMRYQNKVNSNLASTQRHTTVKWSNPGVGVTAYNGLYGEALPERGTFFRLEVYKRVGIS